MGGEAEQVGRDEDAGDLPGVRGGQTQALEGAAAECQQLRFGQRGGFGGGDVRDAEEEKAARSSQRASAR